MTRKYIWYVAVLMLFAVAACGSSSSGDHVNSSPSAVAGDDQGVLTGTTVTLDGSKSWDIDGDQLTYAWSFTERPTGSTSALSDPSVVNPTFVPDVGGRYKVSLIVSDGSSESYDDSVTIHASSAAPVADAGPDQGVPPGSPVQLNGSATGDVDGNMVTYSWSFVSIPSGSTAAISNADSMYPSFTADLIGTYEVELVADDGISGSTTDTVLINASNPPVANAGADQGVATNSVVTLDGSASYDPEGNPVTYSWKFISVQGGVLSDETAMTPTFTPQWDGEYVLALIVNDGTLDSTVDTVTISASSSPVANAGPDKKYTSGATVTLDGSKSYDPDNPAVPGDGIITSYSWSFTSDPSGSATLSDATAVDPTFIPASGGDYVLSLVVSDGVSISQPDTVTITVLTPGAPVRLLPDTGQTTCYDEAGAVINCSGTGQDGDYTINPMGFSINGNGTRTDQVTGLMWQKCTNGQSGVLCADTEVEMFNGYEAQGIYEATYNPATTDVCGDLTLGGHSDWRLPDSMELMQILNYGNTYPAINTIPFPNTLPYFYWSSTCFYTEWCSTSYLVDFGYGQVHHGLGGNMAEDYFVRCVRGSSIAPDFADNGDGTVTDLNTGLVWQQQNDGTQRTWQQALSYCNGLSLSGNGWRLPNIKELATSLYSAVYLPNSTAYWSSTNYGTSAWYAASLFDRPFVTTTAKDNYISTRCVR